MTHKHTRSGLPAHIPFALPATWSPEQALAVIELLDDLRERLWQHYQLALHELIREQYGEASDTDHHAMPIDDPPF